MKSLSVAIISISILGSCAQYSGETYSAVLGDDLLVAGGTYSSGGGITVAAEFREKDGRTLVCGAWAESRVQSGLTRTVARDVLTRAEIFQGRDRVIRGLSFMQKVDPAADYAGSEALCRLTEQRWQADQTAGSFEIRIPRQIVYQDLGDFGGGIAIFFNQTGPGAGDS